MKFGQTSLLSLLALGASCSTVSTSTEGAPPLTFETPQAGAEALVEAARADDVDQIRRILGADADEIISSGDEVADKAERVRFVELYDERNEVEATDEGSFVLVAGELQWPFPIPLIETDAGWAFDLEEGHWEMLTRRIGRNELDTIQTCLAMVDAQHEYASEDRDGDGILEFAQRFLSSPDSMDGLFWPTLEGDPQSPLGPLAAEAAGEGYEAREEGEGPTPYHGYYYRILQGQGPHAAGGEYSYVARDSMIGGFAVVAYPAVYENSGIMTFMVNHDGVLLEKDLGEETDRLATEMNLFDPDESWTEVDVELP